MGLYNPGRPPNVNDLTLSLNGSWSFLGRLVTAGVAVDNANTATPFAQTPLSAGDVSTGLLPNYANTLAGRVLLLEVLTNPVRVLPSAPGSTLAQIRLAPVTISTGIQPGILYNVGERPTFVMNPQSPWLQMISEGGGAATVLVWELK